MAPVHLPVLLLALLPLASCDLKQWVRDAGVRMKEAKRRQAAELEEQSRKDSSESVSKALGALVGITAKAGGVALVGVAAFVAGQRIVALVGERKSDLPKRLLPTSSSPMVTRSIQDVRASNTTEELLSAALEISQEERAVPSPVPPGKSVVLLFDCNVKLSAAADVSARREYFALMSNLTDNGQDFTTVYVPSSLDHSNPHVIERNSSFRPNWRFISSNAEGSRFSSALRSKFDVKEEELRIIVLDRDLQVVSENAIELLRVTPFNMPWHPVNVRDVIGSKFISPNSSAEGPVDMDVSDKLLGLYFSASWCKPCQVRLKVSLHTNIS